MSQLLDVRDDPTPLPLEGPGSDCLRRYACPVSGRRTPSGRQVHASCQTPPACGAPGLNRLGSADLRPSSRSTASIAPVSGRKVEHAAGDLLHDPAAGGEGLLEVLRVVPGQRGRLEEAGQGLGRAGAGGSRGPSPARGRGATPSGRSGAPRPLPPRTRASPTAWGPASPTRTITRSSLRGSQPGRPAARPVSVLLPAPDTPAKATPRPPTRAPAAWRTKPRRPRRYIARIWSSG